MLVGLVYFFVIVLVISVSAIAGISGGVILRPVFDFIGFHQPIEIGFYMAVAILTMTISSTYKQIKSGTKIKADKALTLALGAVIGGWIGQQALEWMSVYFDSNLLQLIQNILSILALFFVLFATRPGIKKFALTGAVWYVVAGLLLGSFAGILAIGGGPINVAIFTIVFGITLKEATVYSITTILFTQLSRLTTMGITGGFSRFDMSLLMFIIPAAIIGGYMGGKLNVKFNNEQIMKIFKFVVVATIFINIWNIIQFGLGTYHFYN